MTPICVIDSSFLISLLLPDEMFETKFIKYIRGFKKDKIIFKTCNLLKYEIGNCLKSSVIRKRISNKQALEIYKAFEEMQIDYQDTDNVEVLDLSIKNNLSFYDASYLYLAKVNKCELLTLDKKLAEIANKISK